MSFTIKFDYRFDVNGFFNDPARRATLEAAAAEWESLIRDEFVDIPAGSTFEISDPSNPSVIHQITLAAPIDDILIFVGARTFPGSTAAVAGPSGYDLAGDANRARISDSFQGGDAVSNFEPWTGIVSFDLNTNWHYTMDEPPSNRLDLFTVAVHEIGHVLGVGTSGAFDALIVGGSTPGFNGFNATALNGGVPVPLDPFEGHVADGFAGDIVLLDPTLSSGSRMRPSEYDKAILADIGYDIAGFVTQGSTPPLASNTAETIFGTAFADVIDGLGGNDQIQTAGGNDQGFGGDGADSIFGGDGDDTLFGGSGADQISGEADNDLIFGDDGNDLLFGGFGADTIFGGADDDQIQAGGGADVIRGGAGNDSIFGQDGADIYEFGLGDGQDQVYDFSFQNEVIRLIDSGFSNMAEALAAISQPFSNVSRITLSDGSYINVFHDQLPATLLTAAHIELFETQNNLPNAAPTGSIGISGSNAEGAILTAVTSGLADTDGLGTFSYSWFRGGADTGAVGNTYLLGAPDIGAQISLQVSYIDGRGTAETVLSGQTAPIRNVNDAPSGAAILMGIAEEGRTLSVSTSSIADADGLGTFSYTWLRDGADTGATASLYALSAADIDAQISVRVSYVDQEGTLESLFSAPRVVSSSGQALIGTSNDDVLIATAGDDEIDGGDGIDTVFFEGNQASYTLMLGQDGISITDRRTETEGGQGTDTLTSIEFLDFGTTIPLFDGPMNLAIIDGPANLSKQDFADITELYIAYFNRAPDAIGLYFWASVYDQGFDLVRMAEAFYDQDETRETYADVLAEDGKTLTDPVAFITAVYNNVLGRAPDQDGFDFWLNQLINNPDITPPSFILSIINGAKFAADPVPQTFLDQDFLAKKAELGAYFAAIKGLSNVDEGVMVMSLFDGSDASLAAAVAQTDAFYVDALDAQDGSFLVQLIGVIDDPFAIA